jgi:uncharacterized membrane protein YidH (DUF202 family)
MFAVYSFVPSGLIHTALGPLPTTTEVLTVLLAVLITLTVLLFALTVYNFVPSELMHKPLGHVPTDEIVALTVLVAVLITLIVLLAAK